MRIFAIGAAVVLANVAAADIQPKDGPWAGTFQFLDADGCPAQMEQQMRTSGAATGGYQTEINFPKPFDPVALNNHDLDFIWTRQGPDKWAGTFTQSEDVGAGTLVTISHFVLHVLSDSHMQQDVRLQVTFPDNLVQMLGMAQATCVVTSIVDHAFQG